MTDKEVRELVKNYNDPDYDKLVEDIEYEEELRKAYKKDAKKKKTADKLRQGDIGWE